MKLLSAGTPLSWPSLQSIQYYPSQKAYTALIATSTVVLAVEAVSQCPVLFSSSFILMLATIVQAIIFVKVTGQATLFRGCRYPKDMEGVVFVETASMRVTETESYPNILPDETSLPFHPDTICYSIVFISVHHGRRIRTFYEKSSACRMHMIDWNMQKYRSLPVVRCSSL